MASKVFVVVLVICALQGASSSDLRKRDLGDLINNSIQQLQTLINGIQGGVNDAITNGENLIQGVTSSIATVVNSTVNQIQGAAAGVIHGINDGINNGVNLGLNASRCAVNVANNLANAVAQAGPNVQACSQSASSPLTDTLADVQSLSGNVTQLALGVPGRALSCLSGGLFGLGTCIANLQADASKVLLLASSLTADVAQFTQAGSDLLGKIAKCGSDEVVKAQALIVSAVANAGKCLGDPNFKVADTPAPATTS